MNVVDASLTTLFGGRCRTDHVPPPITVIYPDRSGKNWFTVLISDITLTVEFGDGDVRGIRRTTTQPVRNVKGQLRRIVRRTNPAALEKKTGWRYSVILTKIPAATGIKAVPGSHHPQFIDVLHREHAVVEDRTRTQKAMGLRNLPLSPDPPRR